jgi:hypothetical protein
MGYSSSAVAVGLVLVGVLLFLGEGCIVGRGEDARKCELRAGGWEDSGRYAVEGVVAMGGGIVGEACGVSG